MRIPRPDHFLVFVYGTLRRAGSNHAVLRGAPCIGDGETEGLWSLRIEQGYPAVVDHGNGIELRHHIVGEVYEVDAKLLEELDAFEDHPIMYERRLAQIRLNPKGTAPARSVEAWLYFYNLPPNGPVWQTGDIMGGG